MERSEHKFVGRTYPPPLFMITHKRKSDGGLIRTATYVHYVP